MTHGIHFLPDVDEVCADLRFDDANGADACGLQVIVVQDGKISVSGPYETLLKCDCDWMSQNVK